MILNIYSDKVITQFTKFIYAFFLILLNSGTFLRLLMLQKYSAYVKKYPVYYITEDGGYGNMWRSSKRDEILTELRNGRFKTTTISGNKVIQLTELTD